MLSPAQLDRLKIVLVRARNPNNIGAAARAMHDFGFRHLCVVNEYAVPFETARSAVDASAVMANAQVCASVAEAVADCTLVVGTTAVGERALEHRLLALPEAGEKILAELASEGGRAALLFGSEKTGLSNGELSHCHWLLTIPMHQHEGARHVSMNLGQAVAVCLYELARHSRALEDNEVPRTAQSGDIERFAAIFTEMLVETGYTHRHPSNSDEAGIRRLILRMGLSEIDIQAWMGIVRQVLRKTRSKSEDF